MSDSIIKIILVFIANLATGIFARIASIEISKPNEDAFSIFWKANWGKWTFIAAFSHLCLLLYFWWKESKKMDDAIQEAQVKANVAMYEHIIDGLNTGKYTLKEFQEAMAWKPN